MLDRNPTGVVLSVPVCIYKRFFVVQYLVWGSSSKHRILRGLSKMTGKAGLSGIFLANPLVPHLKGSKMDKTSEKSNVPIIAISILVDCN